MLLPFQPRSPYSPHEVSTSTNSCEHHKNSQHYPSNNAAFKTRNKVMYYETGQGNLTILLIDYLCFFHKPCPKTTYTLLNMLKMEYFNILKHSKI